MAETKKKNLVRYKFGKDEIDLDHFIHNLDTNVAGYLDSRKDWTAELKAEFQKTYPRYIAKLQLQLEGGQGTYVDLFGNFVDESGDLRTSDEDNFYYNDKGEQISADLFASLKDKKQKNYTQFNASRAVAQYLGKVGKHISKLGKETEPTTEKFDLKKHGWQQYFANKYHAGVANPNLALYSDKEENGDITKTAGRAAFQAQSLRDYAEQDFSKYDFTGSPFNSAEEYKQKVLDVATELDTNGINNNDYLALEGIGIGSDFYDNYYRTSTLPANLTANLELQQITTLMLQGYSEEDAMKVVDEAKAQLLDLIKKNMALIDINRANRAFENWKSEKYEYTQPSAVSYVPNNNFQWDDAQKEAKDALKPILSKLGTNDYIKYGNSYVPTEWLELVENYVEDPSKNEKTLARLEEWYNQILEGKELFVLGDTSWYAIPWTNLGENLTYYAYNPEEKAYRQFSLRQYVPQVFTENLRKYFDKYVYKQENGGIIKALKGVKYKGYDLPEKTKEEQEAVRDNTRIVDFRDKPSLQAGAEISPEMPGLLKGAIAADIISAGSAYVPGYGTAVSALTGIASTAMNFIHDLQTEGFNGLNATNAATNLGLDFVGVLPSVGTYGKATKIGKILTKWAPMFASAWQTVQGFDGATNALNKVIAGEPMSNDDWQDLYLGLSMIVTGHNYLKGRRDLKAFKRRKDVREGISPTATSDDIAYIKKHFSKNSETGKLEPKKTLENDALRERVSTWMTKKNNTEANPWYTGTLSSEPTLEIVPPTPKSYSFKEKLKNAWSGFNKKPDVPSNKEGGILKMENGSPSDWYKNLFKYHQLLGWQKGLDQSKAGPTITGTNLGHHKADNLDEAFVKNLAYTSNSSLVLSDLQSYLTNSNITSAQDFVNAYNADAAKIREFWNYELVYNALNAGDHNNLFKKMFSSRSGNSPESYNIGFDPNLVDRVGSSTWLRRMDRYLNPFNGLKDRIHIVKLGDGTEVLVYKEDNGNIGLLSDFQKATLPKEAQTNSDPVIYLESKTGNAYREPINETPSTTNSDTTRSFSQLAQEMFSPTLTYGLPRILYAERMNRKITDEALKGTKPYLKNPTEIHKPIINDLESEMQGVKNYAKLRSWGSQQVTSDANLLALREFGTHLQGLEEINKGKAISSATEKESAEKAWMLEKENALQRGEIANFNLAQLWSALRDLSKIRLAYLSKKHMNWDTFWKLLEYEAKEKLAKNKAKHELFAVNDIQADARYNFAKYAQGYLDQETINAWNKNTAGLVLTNDESRRYPMAKAFYDLLVNNGLKRYYNYPTSPLYTGLLNDEWKPTETKRGKNGTKLELARLRKEAKNADRFKKQTMKKLELHEKALDRLAKTMYGLIKAKDIK